MNHIISKMSGTNLVSKQPFIYKHIIVDQAKGKKPNFDN